MLRRVSSAQNRNNCTVVESLQRFVASRSNSAARSSRGALSQQAEEQAPSGGGTSVPRTNSMERVNKYLRRDPSGQSKQTLDQARPPRAVSQGAANANKQVRFDIKEGLKEMIKDTGFDAAKIHQQLMQKKMLNKQKQKSADELKLLSQSYSEMQEERQGVKGSSPVFGGSIRGQTSTNRKSTPKNGRNSAQPLSSSARRTMQLLSPTSSTKKQAFNLALRYKKESIESKVRKGEIDVSQLATFEVEEVEQTPKSSRMLPPRPAQMTNLIPEVIEDVNRTEVRNIEIKQQNMMIREQEDPTRRRQSVKSQRSERRAGSIFRRRSESPHLNRHALQSNREKSEDSGQVTCEDDGQMRHHTQPQADEKENLSANRTFQPGQIVRVPKAQPMPYRSNNNIVVNSSETLSINYQPSNAYQHQQVTSGTYVHTETNCSPSFAHHESRSDLNNLQQSDAPVSGYINTPSQILSKVSSQVLVGQEPEVTTDEQNTFQEDSFQGLQVQIQHYQAPNILFRSLLDALCLTEADFLAQANHFSEQIERSKQALHEPLRQDEETIASSARLAQQGLRLPRYRLHLIRVHLRNVLLDSFLPLIHEIIQLRDRLAYRKYTYKLALKHPLKASIIGDICSRLKQKIVLKVLFLQSQFRKNLHSLFTAYHDLLVKKQTVRHIFDHMRTFKQRQVEKQAYLDYAIAQLQDLRKLQAFDCFKRYKQVTRLESEKAIQAFHICQRRKVTRLMLAWKVHMVQKRVKAISMEMVDKFRGMKRRHQVFVNWVDTHREMLSVKTKALQMLSRQNEDGKRALPYTESDFTGEQSSTSLRDQAAAQVWLTSAKTKSEEIFYRQIQELLLEKEHHMTCAKKLNSQMQANWLNQHVPLVFDRNRDPSIWDIQPSQAYLSNKEQIYMAYPELQKTPITKIPATLCELSSDQEKYGEAPGTQNLTKSVSELKKALEPPLHKFMICPQPSQKTIHTQETILETKYSVHQALVAQQNLYGAQSTKVKRSEEKSTVMRTAESKSFPHEEIGHARQSLQSIEPSVLRAVPFKKQTSLVPSSIRQPSTGERAPNQLFQMIKNQIRAPSEVDQVRALPQKAPTSQTKIPPEVQLQSHIKNMIFLLRQPLLTDGQIRARSMALVMREDGFDEDLFVGDQMSLTDFTQVTLQSGVSMARLLEAQAKIRAIEMWRRQLINRLLQKDFDEYRGYHAGRLAIKEWHCHIQKQKLRALNHAKTKRVKGFYELFARWAKANRKLVYETEKQVRHFRAGYVLKTWRKYNQVQGRDRRHERKAIEFYINSLHVRALAGLFRNQHRVNLTKKFQRRQALLKFFKRRWLPRCRARQLLRRVLERCSHRDQSQDRSRYQRQFDVLKNAINTWKKRVQERQMLYKTYLALNHYKLTLICRHFRALKNAPQKTLAVTRMVNSLQEIALQQPFTQMLRVCAVQNLRVREWMEARNSYVCHRFISQLHTMAVKTKIAKLYVQRKFLKALQAHIFRNNYVRPLAFREHQLRSKAFASLRSIKGQKWRRQKLDIVYRALVHRKTKVLLQTVFEALKSNSLEERRERIIEGTVFDFRRHTLMDKSFKLLKFHRMKRRKKDLLNQVADEFHEDRLQREIEVGRTQVHLNTQTGCLLNANQDLLLKVLGEWRFISRVLRRSENQVELKIRQRAQISLLRCFLAWRSIARYQQSDDQSQTNIATRSAVTSSDVFESYQQQHTSTPSLVDRARKRSSLMQDASQARYTPQGHNKSTPALSYVNTSEQQSPLFAQGDKNVIVHHIDENSSLGGATSLIHSSTNNYKFSLGQIKMPSRQTALHGGNSDSTLNARAPIVHMNSVATGGTYYGRDSGVLSGSGQETNSSQNLNQRQVQSNFGRGHHHHHQHHSSAPESSVTQDYVVHNLTPGAYVNTSDGTSVGMDARTNHNGSVESYQNFGGGGRGEAGAFGGLDHNYGVSAQETVISPQVLSREVIEESNQILSGNQHISFDQIAEEHKATQKTKEPSLVTTLNPYNYEIDLPFKEASNHARERQNGQPVPVMRHDYATFSIQECDPANQLALFFWTRKTHYEDLDNDSKSKSQKIVSNDCYQEDHQRVFSASQSSVDDRLEVPTVVEGHFVSLGERGLCQERVAPTQLATIQQRHMGSLTLSNQTGHLHDELESIFKHNEEWKDEQKNREQILQEMANHYQTHMTTKSANLGSIEDSSYQAVPAGAVGSYVPEGYVESESEVQESYLSQGGEAESAAFCQTTIQDEESQGYYIKQGGDMSENEETQEDEEVVSVNNPMDSHILN